MTRKKKAMEMDNLDKENLNADHREQNDVAGAGSRLYFVRLNANERKQHLVFVICFLILAVTGLMVWLPEPAIQFLGRARGPVFIVRGVLHRIAGTVMILVSLYHIYYLLIKPSGRRWLRDMIPKPKDIKDLIYNMLYFIEVKKQPPEFDRFSYKHKMEYLALIAGTTLMSATGLILWFEYFWDKFILDIAALVHGMEAVMACLAVIIWHLYEVHLRPHKFPYDNMWLTGIIDEEEMKEEHPLHYKKIMNDPELQEIYIQEGSRRNG